MDPDEALSLRVSGHLLLGVVRIFAEKCKFLERDCKNARINLLSAFKITGDFNLRPEDQRAAAHVLKLKVPKRATPVKTAAELYQETFDDQDDYIVAAGADSGGNTNNASAQTGWVEFDPNMIGSSDSEFEGAGGAAGLNQSVEVGRDGHRSVRFSMGSRHGGDGGGGPRGSLGGGGYDDDGGFGDDGYGDMFGGDFDESFADVGGGGNTPNSNNSSSNSSHRLSAGSLAGQSAAAAGTDPLGVQWDLLDISAEGETSTAIDSNAAAAASRPAKQRRRTYKPKALAADRKAILIPRKVVKEQIQLVRDPLIVGQRGLPSGLHAMLADLDKEALDMDGDEDADGNKGKEKTEEAMEREARRARLDHKRRRFHEATQIVVAHHAKRRRKVKLGEMFVRPSFGSGEPHPRIAALFAAVCTSGPLGLKPHPLPRTQASASALLNASRRSSIEVGRDGDRSSLLQRSHDGADGALGTAARSRHSLGGGDDDMFDDGGGFGDDFGDDDGYSMDGGGGSGGGGGGLDADGLDASFGGSSGGDGASPASSSSARRRSTKLQTLQVQKMMRRLRRLSIDTLNENGNADADDDAVSVRFNRFVSRRTCKNRRTAALAFYDLLALGASGLVELTQEEAYGDIMVQMA